MKSNDFSNNDLTSKPMGISRLGHLLFAVTVAMSLLVGGCALNPDIAVAVSGNLNTFAQTVAAEDGTDEDVTVDDYPALCVQDTASMNVATPDASKRVDCKPRLYKFLANNNRMQGEDVDDELRIDFVLRMPHGMVNPSCVAVGAVSDYGGNGDNKPKYAPGDNPRVDCGMQMLVSQSGARGTDPNTQLTSFPYLNTYGGDSDRASVANAQQAALNWARNQGEFYTIHNVLVSGDYDYLTISIEGNISYTGKTLDPTNVGGTEYDQYVYAVAAPGRQMSGKTPVNNNNKYYYSSLDPRYVTNISEGVPSYMYANQCNWWSGTGTNADKVQQCNGPTSHIGFDAHPNLWSSGQANWGLVTDYGFPSQGTGAGVAPANSFFVFWYNIASRWNSLYPCSQVTSFYYQWLALKGGKDWVPVQSLTPTAVRVDGQQSYNNYGGNDWYSAFNSPNNRGYNSTPNHLMVPGAGTDPNILQDAQGNIDFGAIKKKEGLDGYFKLVTWPITTNPGVRDQNSAAAYEGCVVQNTPTGGQTLSVHDAYNPLYNNADPSHPLTVKAGMSQEDTNKLLATGWTIDTAFASYNIPRPDAPVIDQFSGYVPTSSRTVTGTGIPGDTVTLFAEDQSHIIDLNKPNNPETRGIRIGSAEVGADGTWSIADSRKIDTNLQHSIRYHAWQTDSSDFKIASLFSNVVQGNFQLEMNKNPEIKQLTVPHTVRNSAGKSEMPADAKVSIKGSAQTLHSNDSLRLYAVPQSQPIHHDTITGQPYDDPSNPQPPAGTYLLEDFGPLDAAQQKGQVHQTQGRKEAEQKKSVRSSQQEEQQQEQRSAQRGEPGQQSAQEQTQEASAQQQGERQSEHWAELGQQSAQQQDPAQTSSSHWFSDWVWQGPVSTFTQGANAGKILFTIVAVLENSDTHALTFGQVRNQLIDTYPTAVQVTSGSRQDGIFGTVTDTAHTGLDPSPASNLTGMEGNHVTVTWPDGSETSTTTDKDAKWHVDVPTFMPPGRLTITSMDRSGTLDFVYNINTLAEISGNEPGNQSDAITWDLTSPEPVSSLPFTGWRRWWLLVVVAAVAIASAAGFAGLVKFKKKISARTTFKKKAGAHARR
ncbi:hypothetical protein [Bifidobacterium sp. ESL0745]|uniref:hypothetical protein n=1 Tax=Bifidobacterium sp. ESL0745 TaxID=2983226 RepID=UPI0023F6314B|nr:hypothetical protein [Bifidobacterium sp. ESL0745]MDF7666176.1 hypothetical protein [Bifidobacterium sp. ESL0745]